MIQDIAPSVLDNQMRFERVCADSTILLFHERTASTPYYSVLVRCADDGSLVFPRYEEFDQDFEAIYALSVEGCSFFIALDADELACPEGYGFERLSTLRAAHPRARAFAAVTCFHLHEWYRDNRYCGRCGRRLSFSHHERALECRSCGNVVYPKIAPAVIVAVTHGDKLLLTRYAGQRDHTRLALVAGFTEIGETAEETVAREVLEETGVQVRSIRYYKSQPWGFASNLLLGFVCELEGSPAITIQKDELGWASWMSRAELEAAGYGADDGVSLTRELIACFANGEYPFRTLSPSKVL